MTKQCAICDQPFDLEEHGYYSIPYDSELVPVCTSCYTEYGYTGCVDTIKLLKKYYDFFGNQS